MEKKFKVTLTAREQYQNDILFGCWYFKTAQEATEFFNKIVPGILNDGRLGFYLDVSVLEEVNTYKLLVSQIV